MSSALGDVSGASDVPRRIWDGFGSATPAPPELAVVSSPKKNRATTRVESSLYKGGPRHPPIPLPLLPSGPGGVHSVSVTRDHKTWSRMWWALSIVDRAEREGFEPSVPFSTHDFQSCTFGHSVTAPKLAVHTIYNPAPSSLGHRSKRVADRNGRALNWRTGRDLNPRCFRTSDFESDTIGHSDTCPKTSPGNTGSNPVRVGDQPLLPRRAISRCTSDRGAARRRTAAARRRMLRRELRRALRFDD